MLYINHHSFSLSALLLLLAVGFFLFRKGWRIDRAIALVFLAFMIAFSWLLVRPSPSLYKEAADIHDQIGEGVPVLLEFQSPY